MTFSNLIWNANSKSWAGRVRFCERDLETSIDFDNTAPTETQRSAAVGQAADLLARLSAEWELECRRAAAKEITEAAYSQSGHEVTESDVDDLCNDMTISALEFTIFTDTESVGGTLVFNAPRQFPDAFVQINFLSDLTIDEVLVID